MWKLVAHLTSDCGVSPGLDAPGGILRFDASRRCDFVVRPGQNTSMPRRHIHTIRATDHS